MSSKQKAADDLGREIASIMGHIRDARRHLTAYHAGDASALDLITRALHVIERDAHYLIKHIVDRRIKGGYPANHKESDHDKSGTR